MKNIFTMSYFKNWLERKSPKLNEYKTKNNNIFILPTNFGIIFAILLIIMLSTSVNYNNSLGFALTFLLMGVGILSIFYTHINMMNLSFKVEKVEPVFLGQNTFFKIKLINLNPKKHFILEFFWHKKDERLINIDLEPNEETTVILPIDAEKRGWKIAPRFIVRSTYPFGFFKAWSWINLDMKNIIYPKPYAGDVNVSLSETSTAEIKQEKSGMEDFSHLRKYSHGDPIKVIHWKSFARHATPMSKQFSESVGSEIWLDWYKIKNVDDEERLSILCKSVIELYSDNAKFGLKIPDEILEPNTGETHYHKCLTALALYNNKK